MPAAKVAFLATALLSLALAGCSSGSDAGGFTIKGPDASNTVTLTASGSGDNFTWDLGDHLTRLYGKKVTHTYDFANGVVPITLTVKKGGESEEHRKQVTLGNGQNANAAFVLEGSTNWTVLGESVTLSAHRSTDPDGDPLRYTWSCQRYGDAVRQSPHVHPGFGGVPFATPPAGAVTAVDAQGPLPQADRVVEGDLCDTLGQGGRPSKHTTISGSFTEAGIYDIYLLASDPVHPTTSGKYRIVATPPEERPNATEVYSFTDTLTVGKDGALQGGCDQATQDDCPETFDLVVHNFGLPLLGKGGIVNLTYESAGGVTVVEWELYRGSSLVATGGTGVVLGAADLLQGSYSFRVLLRQGGSPAGVTYTIDATMHLDMDPFKVY